ncbi:hypothetical protein AAC387_Pa07g2973 [Persea americana]
MVSQDSSSNESISDMFHQYTPDMAAGPTSFTNHSRTENWDGQSSNVLPSIQSLGERIYRSTDLVQSSVSEDSEMFRQRHLMNLQGGKESDHQDFSSALGKGLTLSLYSHLPSDVQIPSFNYREADPIVNQIDPSYLTTREEPRVFINAYEATSMLQNHSCSISSNEVASSLVIRNSRYLKPAQCLLDEVISVIKDVELKPDKQMRKDKSVRRILQDGTTSLRGCTKAGKLVNGQTRNTLCSNECSSASKQDIQIRVEKLVALLEEVNRRQEQYRHKMEEVMSSFEVVAGLGSAKSYISLAPQAMSRHFCSLRHAIVTQICAARRCLSEDILRNDGSLGQLSLFDQNTRQKRASPQPLGMISTQQAWRPIRGLPENAVAILRAWLFEHFLHPYPNDSEKLLLAAQTGLSRNQVSNWFINARVRLWKPMIEDMYREEIKEEVSTGSSISVDNNSMTMEVMSQIV